MPSSEFIEEIAENSNVMQSLEEITNELPKVDADLGNMSNVTNSPFWDNINDWLPKVPEFKLRLPEWQDVENVGNALHTAWDHCTTWVSESWQALTVENIRNTADEFPQYVTEKTAELQNALEEHQQEIKLGLIIAGATVIVAGACCVAYNTWKGKNQVHAPSDTDEKKTVDNNKDVILPV